MTRFYSQTRVAAILSDGKPRCSREIAKIAGLSNGAAENALRRLWKRKLVQRTKSPIFENERVFKGRAGVSRNTRPYHLYILTMGVQDSIRVEGREFVSYNKKYLDARGGGKRSKAKIIIEFLEKNKDLAFFSKDIVDSLADYGVKTCDIMTNVRRYEKKGLVYVRGYRLEDRQTPLNRLRLPLSIMRTGVRSIFPNGSSPTFLRMVSR